MTGTIIVVGNEKGGSGKTTTCMHLITAFLYTGKKVGSIDLDYRQLSLTTYICARKKNNPNNPIPEHLYLERSPEDSMQTIQKNYEEYLLSAIKKLQQNNDIIIIDTAAGDHLASQIAGSYADKIITPMNESFIDMELIVRQENSTFRPGVYSNLVWQQKLKKAKQKKELDWIILRNRTTHFNSNNRKKIEQILNEASKRLGFRTIPGLSERTIYREMFNDGITLSDFENNKLRLTPSHLIARQELRNMIKALNILNKEIIRS